MGIFKPNSPFLSIILWLCFSRKRRGIKKTIGKVAAVGGALYVGKKLAGGIEVNGEGKFWVTSKIQGL